MYFEFFLKSFSQQFVYRTNTFLHVVNSFIYLFVTISIWSALYVNKVSVDGINISEMLTYVLMAQFVGNIVRLPISSYIAGRASSGIISIDFIRPVNLKMCAISDSLGKMVFNALTSGIPMILLGSLLWGLVLPSDFYRWIYFIISLLLAIMLYSSLEYIMGLTSFWTKTDFHIRWIIGAFMTLFSGSHIPLWFYPEPIKTIADMLPFKYFIFEPINIFLGKTSVNDSLNIILFQIIWLIIFLVIEKIIWHFAQRVVTVQGG